jgi:hypothetical protein
METDEHEVTPFWKWISAKDERFYTLFLFTILIIFGLISLVSIGFIAVVLVDALWIIFYFTILKKG